LAIGRSEELGPDAAPRSLAAVVDLAALGCGEVDGLEADCAKAFVANGSANAAAAMNL
jgi:hypothetical protein